MFELPGGLFVLGFVCLFFVSVECLLGKYIYLKSSSIKNVKNLCVILGNNVVWFPEGRILGY